MGAIEEAEHEAYFSEAEEVIMKYAFNLTNYVDSDIKWMPIGEYKEHEKQGEKMEFVAFAMRLDSLPFIIYEDLKSKDKLEKNRILVYRKSKQDYLYCNIPAIIDFIRQDEREKMNEEAILKCKKVLKAGRERFKKEESSNKKNSSKKEKLVIRKKANGRRKLYKA